jgi:hypothetical protein
MISVSLRRDYVPAFHWYELAVGEILNQEVEHLPLWSGSGVYWFMVAVGAEHEAAFFMAAVVVKILHMCKEWESETHEGRQIGDAIH